MSAYLRTPFNKMAAIMDSGIEVPFEEWSATSYNFSFNGQPIPISVTELRFRLVACAVGLRDDSIV